LDGIYEDIEAVPMEEKKESAMSRDLVQEEDYDDAGEPEEDYGEEEEEEEEESALSRDLVQEEGYDDAGEPVQNHGEVEEEEKPLQSPTGVHLCALGSVTLFLLYCSHAGEGVRGAALSGDHV
jgi:hypothetical protein